MEKQLTLCACNNSKNCDRNLQVGQVTKSLTSANNNLVLLSENDDKDLYLEPKIAGEDALESDVSVLKEEIILTMCDNSMQNTLLHRLNTFRRNRELCDVVLFVQEKEILAHKVVLAACSSVLMDMFVGREDDMGGRCSSSSPSPTAIAEQGPVVKTSAASSTAPVFPANLASPTMPQPLSYYEFAESDYHCFEAIVNYAYSAHLDISNKKVGELYKTACILQVAPVAKACAHYLINNLNIMDCIGIRRQANIHDDVLVEHVDNFIAENFARIVDESPEFTHLPLIKVRLILSIRDTEQLCCGEDIALRALQYFQSLPHVTERTEQWIELLIGKTHMLYMGEDTTLLDCSGMDDRSFVGASDIIQDYKLTGGYLPRTYSGSKMLDIQTPANHITGATAVHLTSGRLNNTKISSAEKGFWIALAFFLGRLVALSIQLSEAEEVIKLRSTSLDDDILKTSQTGQQETLSKVISSASNLRIPIPHMKSPRCSIGGVFINGKIIVCGGYDRGTCLKSVEEYDMLESSWSSLADMTQCRGRFDAAVLGNKVYAVAGSNGSVDLKTVECYDLETKKWSFLYKKFFCENLNKFDLCCAALDRFIYCIGGCCEQNVLDECEKYIPELDEWSLIAPLRTARFQAGCTSWHDLIVVCGGSDGWKCLDSVEAYNSLTGKWLNLIPLKTARRGCAVIVVKDCLFVIGGHDGTQSLNSVEILDSPNGEWRSGPSLTTPRANVKAIVTPDNEIYVLGGFDGTQFLSSVEVLDNG
ncbi:unnamed protein product [Thelazia callipaeda]|uniref:BTB domain-containing protein n=1 Tax=Thelazia callipaeda TaxID=103827 RepID=A0A0N5CJG7_THECL|nr:unnamed protein product [Thelazia callipaeda]